MIERRSLKELNIDVITGQILSRVAIKDENIETTEDIIKVIIPKAISSDGTIAVEELPEEKLKVKADKKKVSQKGDIVIKLSTPYDAAMVDSDSEGCIVPSFCAIVKNHSDLDSRYLLAFLNSKECKRQLSAQVAGAGMTVLSVGKVKSVEIPIPTKAKQIEIGEAFIKAQKKIKIIKRIIELESQRNDALFNELTYTR